MIGTDPDRIFKRPSMDTGFTAHKCGWSENTKSAFRRHLGAGGISIQIFREKSF